MYKDKNKIPHVSIILPVYNAEKTINKTVESILNQTFEDFELILIDDGSKDNSLKILDSFHDSRIKIIKNPTNLGLVESLNKGIQLSEGKYIARMDADDIMEINRIEEQFIFMETHPNIGICGGWMEIFNDTGTLGYLFHGKSYDSIKAELLFNSPIAHPTFFIRAEIFKKYRYDPYFKYCEDYELLSRLLVSNCGNNIDKIVLRYRKSEDSQTSIGEKKIHDRFLKISKVQTNLLLNELGFTDGELNKEIHYNLCLSGNIKKLKSNYFIQNHSIIKNYFNKIIEKNKTAGFCKNRNLCLLLGKIWIKIIRYHHRGISMKKLSKYLLSKYFIFGLLYTLEYFYILFKVKYFTNSRFILDPNEND